MNLLSIVIISYITVLLVTLIIIISFYNKYIHLKNNESSGSGEWFGGTFYANPEILFPIDDKNVNDEILKTIKQHKIAVLCFWIFLLLIIPVILIFKQISY